MASALLVVGCSGSPSADTSSPTGSGTAASAPTSGSPAGSAPTSGPTSAGPGSSTPSATAGTSEQPVPKVQRSDGPSQPTASAKPARVGGTVRYDDGIALRVVSVRFAEEKQKGPGSFPGRAFAVLRLEVTNKSPRALSMQTVVVTVLDKNGAPVPPVYTQEAKVQDFAGSIRPGKTARASYAFAVPKSSRSKVTVNVDFDGAHTSAVFRGKLG